MPSPVPVSHDAMQPLAPLTRPVTADSDGSTTLESALDPRTFHLFTRDGAHHLYCTTSGLFAEINVATLELLRLCREHDWEAVDAISARTNPAWRAGDARRTLEPLIEQGHFRFVPINQAEQAGRLDRLWRHRPRRLQLLLAQHCNLKCVYCYEEFNGSNAHRRLMSQEMAKSAVDYLVHRSGPRTDLQVTFFGGEPLLNKKVLKWVVAYCREIEAETEKRFTFELITNATLLDEETLDYLVENRFLLMISLDGYREMHEHNRPSVAGHETFDTILANAKRAHKRYRASGLGLPVKVRANLTHEHHDLERVVRFLEGEGFTTIGVAAVDELPWYHGTGHGCTSEDLDEVGKQSRRLLEIGLTKTIAGKRCTPYEARLVRSALKAITTTQFTRGLGCGVGRNTNIVDTNGQIYPCHRYGDMGMYTLGNVQNMTLDEQLVRDYYARVNAASSTKCASCWGRNLCGGPCAWEVSDPNGEIWEPHEDNCRRVLRGFEDTLMLRKRLTKEAPELLPEDSSACGDACVC